MIDFYADPTVWQSACGRLDFTENGEPVGLRYAYAADAMVGLHLTLPRALGAASVALHLLPDGADEALVFPLRRCGGERETDLYALLLDAATLAPCGDLFTASLVIGGIFGRLYACPAAGGRVGFLDRACHFTLLFTDRVALPRGLVGGALYALPIREIARIGRLFRGSDRDYPSFFAHLRALHVCGLWLCPPVYSDSPCGRWDPSDLPPAFVSAAEEAGILLLFDLLCLVGVEGDDDSAGFFRAPVWQGSSAQACFCGEDGVIFRACRWGAGGFVLRETAQFGDALLAEIKRTVGNMPLLGLSEGRVAPIAYGARRRYLLGGAFDGMIGHTALRKACLSYLIYGKTEDLAGYFENVIAATPEGPLALQTDALSTYETGSFFSAVSEALYAAYDSACASDAYAFSEMGHLLLATLPGLSLYLCGEENGLPYPPAVGETVGPQLAFFLRLCGLRRREAVYRDGRFRLLHLSGDLLVFARTRKGEALFTVLNRSPERLTVSSPDGFSVVFGGRGLKNVFSVRPFSGVVLKASYWEGEACRLRFIRERPRAQICVRPPRRQKKCVESGK